MVSVSFSRGKLFLLLVLLFLPLAHAQPRASPATGAVTATAVSGNSIAVLPVRASGDRGLVDLQVTRRAVDASISLEKEKYQEIRSRASNVPEAEKELVLSQLAQQRQRVLLVLLNKVINVYQQADYLTGRLETSLVRLQALYAKKQASGVSLPRFEARMDALKGRLAAVQAQRERTVNVLEAARASEDTAAGIRSSRDSLSSLLDLLRPFVADYKELAQDVLSL